MSVVIYIIVILSSILCEEENTQISYKNRRYISKRHRWKLVRLITKGLRVYILYAGAQIGKYETTWHEYKMRHKNSIRIRRAQMQVATPTPSSPNQRRGPAICRRSRKQTLLMQEVLSMSSLNTYGEPIHQHVAAFDTDSCKIGIDNRASACISAYIEDFQGPVRRVNRTIKGFGGERITEVSVGTIVWNWCDNDGVKHRFVIPNSYYVPAGGVRLLSPQHWAKTQLGSKVKHKEGIGETTTAFKSVLFWGKGNHRLDVLMGVNDNVATFYLAPGYNKFELFCQKAEMNYEESLEIPVCIESSQIIGEDEDEDGIVPPSPKLNNYWSRLTGLPISRQRAADEAKQQQHTPRTTSFNFAGPTVDGRPAPVIIEEEEERLPTTAEQELLRYHHRMGHVSFAKLQNMAKQNIIPRHLAKCQIPACGACLFAKATRRQWRNKRKKDWTNPREANKPGEIVSVDQLISPIPGLVPQMTGKLTRKRYKYATVFVDQYSGFSYVYLQKSADAEETVLAKRAFEETAKQNGVDVIAYHADNGIFRANKWVKECKNLGQRLTFAGVNAHHANGLAERRIRSLQDLARAMLIHQHRRWQMAATAHLWPFALRMANDAINETPNLKDKLGRSPAQLFSGSGVQTNTKHWIPFGCPAYVVDNALQSGKGIYNKWEYRSRVGIYLGRSPFHGLNVALVLDRSTGLVSPQFHVTFDPSFRTVKDDKFNQLWQMKAGFLEARKEEMACKHTSKESIYPKRPAPEPERASQLPTRRSKKQKPEHPQKDGEPPNNTGQVGVQLQQPSDDSHSGQNESPSPTHSENEIGQADSKSSNDMSSEDPATHQQADSRQFPEPARDIIKAMEVVVKMMKAELSKATVGDIEGELFSFQAMFPNYAGFPEKDPIQVYKATSDPDTMYHHEAMKQPDAVEFRVAMDKEWDDQLKNGNFTVIHRSEVPEGATVLPTVWQMRRKRDIRTRQIKKYKARLNIDGSKMRQGLHYDQTYAPVASWNSIRTLLLMSALHGWHTRQIDYVLAFPQAPVEREIYMQIPRGFKIKDGDTKDFVLKVHRNIYGQKQAGRVWNKYLTDRLIHKVGFKQSAVDECVFYRGNVMYVLYTDDSILAGPDLKEIDRAIEDIKAAQLNITIEGDVQDFLGVNIDRRPDGTIHMTQPHLIDQILADLRMPEGAKTKDTPAATSKILRRHSNSSPFDGSFNYRSVVGKLNYLEKGSRPDIAYAVHQCARFSADPKQEHGDAIRWLAKYLKGTRDKGMVLKPTKERQLEVFVDADFAGNWHPDETDDRDTARSRHGYLVYYAGCPILWKSQLQSECALSSTESEITGLSYSLRDAIPIMNLFQEMMAMGMPVATSMARVHCRVFEDNTGALEIAKVAKYRPRTKHLNIRLHHFRSYVDEGQISIHKIDTLEQPADILTKPLNAKAFGKFRKMIMGW